MTVRFFSDRFRRRTAAGGAAAILLVAAMAGAQAALPPYWQRAAEIQAILDNGDVARKLDEAPIDRIERVGDDLYRIQAGTCALDIRVVGESRSDPGPRKFRLEIGDPACK
ncbi:MULTISPECIES: hypothetical protein [unclassified Inquilinus]|uniref:hypothetical protein n=1 Tax=unclassified Inquilinus TaxID=2645927 RepID=UPI003F8FF5CA